MEQEAQLFAATVARVVPAGEHPLTALFRFVQSMPYRFPGPRDAVHTLEQGWGTCSGKNYLLAELLRAAGVPCAHLLAVCDLGDSRPDLPPHLRELADSGPLPDVHSLLTVVGPAGPVLVDTSWDPPLACVGFPVQAAWAARTDTVLAVRPTHVYAVCGESPSAEKEALRARVYRERPSDQERRNLYLMLLSEWMQVLRRPGGVAPDANGAL